MGSIRPLFTITVLTVVGVYLYVQINKGPTRPNASAHANADAAQDGIPPLAPAGGGATLAQDTSAPTWPQTNLASAAAPNATAAPGTEIAKAAPALGAPAKNSMPDVPPIPELPELPQAGDATQAATPNAAPPIELPKNVPGARYGDEAGPNLGAGATPADAPGTLPALPALPTLSADNPASPATTGVAAAPGLAPQAQASPAAASNVPPAALNATPASPINDRYGLPSAPAVEPAPGALNNPPTAPPAGLQSPALNSVGDDRYGAGANSALPAAGIAPAMPVTPPNATMAPATAAPLMNQPGAAGASYAASMPAIQAALDRRDLKQAHQLLSKWYGNDSLTPAEAQQVETLLGQLAGSVIYSNEHQLEPARVVRPGETLETIAKEYGVPWQLLAKINGVAAADQVRPGQELKVVRGPFSATIDLRRSELALEVDGRYAGTFAIAIPPGTPVTEGQWLVEQKLGGDAPVALASAPPATPQRRIVLRSANAGGATLMIDGASAGPGQPGAIRVAAQDAEDLSDILSVGSRVIVRR